MAEGGLSIDSLSEGYSTAGINEFIEKVTDKIDGITAVVKDVSKITEAVDLNWTGNAANKFKENLQEHVNEMADDIDDALNKLIIEVNNVGVEMANFDDDLIGKA